MRFLKHFASSERVYFRFCFWHRFALNLISVLASQRQKAMVKPVKECRKFMGLQQNLWAISRTTGCVFKAWQGKKNAASMGGPDGSGMGETHRLQCILPGETESGSAGEQPGKG